MSKKKPAVKEGFCERLTHVQTYCTHCPSVCGAKNSTDLTYLVLKGICPSSWIEWKMVLSRIPSVVWPSVSSVRTPIWHRLQNPHIFRWRQRFTSSRNLSGCMGPPIGSLCLFSTIIGLTGSITAVFSDCIIFIWIWRRIGLGFITIWLYVLKEQITYFLIGFFW